MMWQKLLKSKKKYIFASIQGMILTGVKENAGGQWMLQGMIAGVAIGGCTISGTKEALKNGIRDVGKGWLEHAQKRKPLNQ